MQFHSLTQQSDYLRALTYANQPTDKSFAFDHDEIDQNYL